VTVIGIYNATGAPVSEIDGPTPGDSYVIYNGACELPGATTLDSTGDPTIAMDFTRDTCRFYGLSGTFTYTGSGPSRTKAAAVHIQMATDAVSPTS